MDKEWATCLGCIATKKALIYSGHKSTRTTNLDHYDSGRGDSPESFNSTKLSPPKGRSKSQGQRPQSLVSEDSEISTTSFEDNNRYYISRLTAASFYTPSCLQGTTSL